MICKKENGLYLVLAAFFTLVLASLCALSLGLGFVFASRAQMQVLANVASVGALDRYLHGEEEDELARRQAAIARVNALLSENRKPGTKTQLQIGNSSGAGGTGASSITFGNFYPDNPNPQGGGPCDNEYPCFQEVGSDTAATAIRVVLQNPAENPVGIPFGQVLGYVGIDLHAVSTSAAIETCGAYLLDASLSTVGDTHKLSVFNLAEQDPNCSSDCTYPDDYIFPRSPVIPVGAGMFTINKNSIFDEDENEPLYPYLPHPNSSIPFEYNYWAYMFDHENPPGPDDFDPSDSIYHRGVAGRYSADHFWSDYKETPIIFGDVTVQAFVDKYMQPEPLRSFFLGFNAGLRLVDAQATIADRAMMLGFTNQIWGRREPPETDPPGPVLTSDFTRLLQITNMNNAGVVNYEGNYTSQPKPGNYVERGWLPVLYSGNSDGPESDHGDITGTNIVGALETAIADLSNNCPAHSRKFIVLATQGQSTCLDSGEGLECMQGYDEGLWSLYMESEERLLNDVLNSLKDADIALSVLMAGVSARPNYRNIVNPEGDCGDSPGTQHDTNPNCFYNFETAQREPSIRASCEPPTGDSGTTSIVSCASGVYGEAATMDDEEAFRLIKQMKPEIDGNSIFFGRPNGVFAHMAMETGGQMCPIMSPPTSSDEYICMEYPSESCSACPQPCKLKNSVRVISGTESRPLEYLSTGAQAARCVINTLGSNRLILVEPDKVL